MKIKQMIVQPWSECWSRHTPIKLWPLADQKGDDDEDIFENYYAADDYEYDNYDSDEYCVKYELNQYKKMRIEGKFWIDRTANESMRI